MATVTNTVKFYSEKGVESITSLNRNINSDQARRKFDGRTEARIIEIACSPAPEGHSRWTLRLLEEPVPLITKIIGPYVAFLSIGSKIGLYELLIKDFGPQYANAIMDYAIYSIIAQSDVSKDFQTAMDRYLLFSDNAYSDIWLSDFFGNRLQDSQAWDFRNDWAVQCQKRGIGRAWICIDGSNNDCNSDGNFLAEKGKSKSHDAGDIVSYMWTVSANNGTPITYSVYRGGQADSKGFSCIASSDEMTADEKDAIYQLRQVSEKQYAIFKSQIGYSVLRVHSTNGWVSKYAVGFIAGILRNELVLHSVRN